MKRAHRPPGRGHVFKRGARWWISFWSDGQRHRESSRSPRRTVALALLAERIALHRPPPGGVADFSLRDAVGALLARYDLERRPCARRARCALAHVLEAFPDARARDVDEARLYAYTQARLEARAGNGSINQELGALRRALRLAHEMGRLARVPRFRMLKAPPARAGFVEREQLDAILAHLPAHARPPVLVAFLTGWRVTSEVLTRTWADADLAGGWLRLQPGETKSGEPRMFPIVGELRDVLEQQEAAAEALRRRTGRRPDHVFFRPSGRPLRSIRAAWRKASAAAGFPHLRPHDLRRAAVRNLERAGVPRSTAQRLVGHRSDSIYARYAIVDSAMLREAGAKLDAVTQPRSVHSGSPEPGAEAALESGRLPHDTRNPAASVEDTVESPGGRR